METQQIVLSEKSYYDIEYLPNNLLEYANFNFDKLFDLHPNIKGKVLSVGNKLGDSQYQKEVNCKRWHKSYLNTPKVKNYKHNTYMFSGIEMKA